MVKQIIFKEISILFKQQITFIYWALIIITFAISAVAFLYKNEYYIKQYSQKTMENFQTTQEKCSSFSDVIFHTQFALSPPSSLSFLIDNNEEKLPNAITYNYFVKGSLPYFASFRKRNDFSLSYSPLDWTFVIAIIVSFFCLLFSYSSFSGEKVTGTLRLTLSNNIARWKLFMCKYTAILYVVFIPILFGMIISLIIFNTYSTLKLDIKEFYLLLLFLIVTMLFVSFNVLIGLISSVSFSKPILSLNFCIIVYVLFLAYPHIPYLFSKFMISPPTVEEIVSQQRDLLDKVQNSEEYSLAWSDDWIGNPPNEELKKRIEGQRLFMNFHTDLVNELNSDFKQQTLFTINASKFSPYFLYQDITHKIADNNYCRLFHFEEQMTSFFSIYVDYLNDIDRKDPDSYHCIWPEGSAKYFMSSKKIIIEELPFFKYSRPDIKDTIFSFKFELLFLVVINSIMLLIGIHLFNWYNIR